jgi:signal transduction histidine kinase
VSEAVATVEGSIDEEHTLVLDLPDDPLHADADPERLRQVLVHLIDNAVKFSPDGGTVTVAARRRNGAVHVSVSDEGVGIPPSEHERIFRKFYRGDTSGRGGTGLGLFIVQGLVHAMGGSISVESAEGGGASFSIELPLSELVGEAVPQSKAGRV